MKTILLISSLLCCLISSCDDTEENDGLISSMDISLYVDLLVQDNEGVDLLDPNVPNTLNTDQIRLYYINGDEKVEVYDPNLDYERNFKIVYDDNLRFLRLFVNDNIVNGYTETLLDWGNGNVDAIRSVVTKTNTSIVCDSVWFNGKLEYPSNNEFEPRRMFLVVK